MGAERGVIRESMVHTSGNIWGPVAFMQPCMQSFLRAPAPAGLALHRP